MNILFVCRYNNFRSKFAEAIFNARNKNPEHVARSAGVAADYSPPQDMVAKINAVAQELGYTLSDEKTAYTDEVAGWADLIVNVASDVTLEPVAGKAMLSWNVDDVPTEAGVDSRITLVKALEERVSELVSDLNREK